MIYTDEKVLRTPCTNATEDEVGSIVEQLEMELGHSGRMGRPGIGLAAPQIGIHKNVAIIRIDENHSINLVNCNIQNKYDSFIFRGEGCLSIPNIEKNTMRYGEIHIINNLVYPHAFILTGLMSVAAQHELDHLNSILITDIAIPEEKPKTKIRPNDKCYCGSNQKFKRCHGK